MSDFLIDSLRGGLDDFTPESALPKDACTIAENAEFFYSTMGERRAGCVEADVAAAITANASKYSTAWLFEHTPTKNEAENEQWMMTLDSDNTPRLYRHTSGGWSTISFPTGGTPITTSGQGYKVYGQSLHGKLFLAYKSSSDRLHVWDGTSLRRAGLAAQAAPTAADTAGVGTYPATIRYYRTRMIKKSGSTIQVRSEPSTSVAITPSGVGPSVTVTRAALVGESETHWEIEASTDNIVFYKLSEVAAATSTYVDTALVATYSNGSLSDPVGTYDLIPSVRYLSVDEDRLMLASSHETTADGSAVRWTPFGLDELPGPDERLNSTTDPRVDLDGLEGGDITNIARAVNGTVYVMKSSHTYKLLRTGQLTGSYEAQPITKKRGAFPRSLVEANDEAGRPAQYFLDPWYGPMRAGAVGLQHVGHGVRTLWQRINRTATIPCHGVFYPKKQQVWWWLALDGADSPNYVIKLQTNLVTTDDAGRARGGWSTVALNNRLAKARCSALFARDIETADLEMVPFIGQDVDAPTVADNLILLRCDTGTDDEGQAYTATIRTRPFFLANILNRYGILAGALLGSANSKVRVTAERDFGTETLTVDANMTPAASEGYVIAPLDNLTFTELFACRLSFTDNPTVAVNQWQLLQFALKGSPEQTP